MQSLRLLFSFCLFIPWSLGRADSGFSAVGNRYRCILTRDRGPCREHYIRWGWSVTLDKCISYNYSGCGGTENRFITRAECQKACGSSN
ncbi:Collagen alpha-3(VI) chain [Paragonimus heterotremus]|uniref:Collagen alpha-3(VI) chain n=1 Tax=Paragonimus heterotremus TaxID=100268 RepID=A0A8J4TFP0_9TREM|nr:Collagen alpha-3(VI) chain [Paragonimus heterotremus]